MEAEQQLTACVLAIGAKLLEKDAYSKVTALDGLSCDSPKVGAAGVSYSQPPAQTLIRVEKDHYTVVLQDQRGKVARWAEPLPKDFAP
ncbi:hypothetical protein [Deinococcus sp. Marseille-Q6407]|uniref:hypothetical protein n=1 Tax=Deinococcus sp. Marseille-Q6407 TaxID=2969223 RepID=UPI0021C095F9|nr:hypothetical protein [Deinococcus sp. Marseille-Q6407]